MEELRIESELISIDDLVEAMNVAGSDSEELLTKTFKREDVEGTPAEISRKMIQRVVETAQLDLTDTDRFKLYGVVLTRALAMQAESDSREGPFLLTFGKKGSRDRCPKTIWIRRPEIRRTEDKAQDTMRKSLLWKSSLLAMLKGIKFHDFSSSSRRLKTLKDLDVFFGYLPTREEKTSKVPGIASRDLIEIVCNDFQAEKHLDDLIKVFPVELVKSLNDYFWAVRFYKDYKSKMRGKERGFIGCASFGKFLWELEIRSTSPATDDAEREKLKQTIDLLNKLRNFVNEHAKDKIAMF